MSQQSTPVLPGKFSPANRLNGIGEYYFSQKLRQIEALNKAGKQIINLGIGSPDLPPHPEVINVLTRESQKPSVHAYQGYKGAPVLRQAIADWYHKWYAVDLDPETEILPLLGSKEGIMHICMSFLNPGDIALVPDPGYPTYQAAAKLAGATIITYPLKEANNWFPDFYQLKEQVKNAKGKRILMFTNYPHMPSGKAPARGVFENLVLFASDNNILLVHDNPYSFILNEEPMSMLSVPGAKNCVIELNSLSKSHNMAGWRVGMLCSNSTYINDALRFKSNMDSGMFLPVQYAAAKALELGKEWFDELNSHYKARREKVFHIMNYLQGEYDRSQVGMFVWAKVSGSFTDGYQLSDDVLEKAGVFITPGGIFGDEGKNYIRISLCSPVAKLDEAIQRIQSNY